MQSFITKLKIFAAHIHQHDSSTFVGVNEVTILRDRNTLALVLSMEGSGTIEELANVAVNVHSHLPPKSLVCLQRDTIEPWGFSWLSSNMIGWLISISCSR